VERVKTQPASHAGILQAIPAKEVIALAGKLIETSATLGRDFWERLMQVNGLAERRRTIEAAGEDGEVLRSKYEPVQHEFTIVNFRTEGGAIHRRQHRADPHLASSDCQCKLSDERRSDHKNHGSPRNIRGDVRTLPD
jgi:hypothetical protein